MSTSRKNGVLDLDTIIVIPVMAVCKSKHKAFDGKCGKNTAGKIGVPQKIVYVSMRKPSPTSRPPCLSAACSRCQGRCGSGCVTATTSIWYAITTTVRSHV